MQKCTTRCFISRDGYVEVHTYYFGSSSIVNSQTSKRVKLYTNETLHLGGGEERLGASSPAV